MSSRLYKRSNWNNKNWNNGNNGNEKEWDDDKFEKEQAKAAKKGIVLTQSPSGAVEVTVNTGEGSSSQVVIPTTGSSTGQQARQSGPPPGQESSRQESSRQPPSEQRPSWQPPSEQQSSGVPVSAGTPAGASSSKIGNTNSDNSAGNPEQSGSSAPGPASNPTAGTSGTGVEGVSPGAPGSSDSAQPGTTDVSPEGNQGNHQNTSGENAASSINAGFGQSVEGGSEPTGNSSSESSSNYAVPVGIAAGVGAALLLLFLFFFLKRRKAAKKVAAKERYEAMMANTSLPRTANKAPIVSLLRQEPFKVFQRISALFIQSPSPLSNGGTEDEYGDRAPLTYSNPTLEPPAASVTKSGLPLKSCFAVPPEVRISVMDEKDRIESPSPIPLEFPSPSKANKRESAGWFGSLKRRKSIDSLSVLSKDSKRLSLSGFMKGNSFLSTNSGESFV